jgi:hypothetical protein
LTGKNKKMKNKKILCYIARGRKWVFTLALFILVFAAASAVKVEAASTIMGWLWGGSEEASDGDSYNGFSGTETGVGWISMNKDNPGAQGTNDYRVVINADNTVSGYAWANAGGNPDNGQQNGLGWIDFNPQDHCVTDTNGVLDDLALTRQYEADNCEVPSGSGCSKGVMRSGDTLTGCARFVSIAQASVTGNNGGWDGWLRMEDVTINPATKQLSGYAWNGEKDLNSLDNFVDEGLGWISFGGATIEDICELSILPPPVFNLGNSTTLTVSAKTGGNPTPNEIINFIVSGTNPEKFNVPTSCTTGPDGECPPVNVTSVDRESAWTATITAQSANCAEASTNGIINPIPTCVVTCDPSVEVAAGGEKFYNVTATGAGCSALRDCSVADDPSKIHSDWDLAQGKCKVTVDEDAVYDSVTSVSSAGVGPDSTCNTTVNVVSPGWIETTP